MPPDQARAQNQISGPNGLIERQVTRELMDLFNIDEQTLNTQGLQVTTTIDPQAQKAAEDAVSKYMDGQAPDMRTAVVSIDPHNGAVKAYYGGNDAHGFDFAQAGLQTGSSFKAFALIAALEQGIGLGYQVDSSPLTVNGIKITNVDGESCGTCNIAQALKQSLNTSYYRLMLKLKHGADDVADAAHQAGIATSFPGVDHTLSEDGKGGPPNNGIVLGQYQTRVFDMASAYATLAASVSTTDRTSCRKWSTPRAGCCSTRPTPTTPANTGSPKTSPTTSRRPCSRSPRTRAVTRWPAGGRPRPRPAPRSWVTPTPTRMPGWSATPRRCRQRYGWAP